MEFINRPIVRFIKPHFIFNKVTKEVVIVPTIAANHQLILDIAAQHVAVGKILICTTRTS